MKSSWSTEIIMKTDVINQDYFDWIVNLVCEGRYHENISYRRLLRYLHDTHFIYLIRNDENRAADGLNLRHRFVYDYLDVKNIYIDDFLHTGPCSVLEMMVALAIRCEETIMDDPRYGNRSNQWFWGMIKSLGLFTMTDDRFSEPLVKDIVTKFLHRQYAPTGQGSLFTIPLCDKDLREVEIWIQLNWYLNSIT